LTNEKWHFGGKILWSLTMYINVKRSELLQRTAGSEFQQQ